MTLPPRIQSEADISRLIQLAASGRGARLLRNNVGALKDDRGVHVRFGLCAGSSDLIGWTHDGRFLAVEIKLPGKHPTREQASFIEAVLAAGGRAGVARSVEDLERILEG